MGPEDGFSEVKEPSFYDSDMLSFVDLRIQNSVPWLKWYCNKSVAFEMFVEPDKSSKVVNDIFSLDNFLPLKIVFKYKPLKRAKKLEMPC